MHTKKNNDCFSMVFMSRKELLSHNRRSLWDAEQSNNYFRQPNNLNLSNEYTRLAWYHYENVCVRV